MKACPICKKINNDNAVFCYNCGNKLPCEKVEGGSFLGSLNEYIGHKNNADLNWKVLFSDIFKSHTSEDAETIFIAGTATTTPLPTEVSKDWPHPWFYSRVLMVFLLATFILWMCVSTFGNFNALPGMIVVGSFSVPLATMVLFMELNVWRNVSMFHIIRTFLIGGTASLFATLFLFSIYTYEELDFIGALLVGLTEEFGKAIIVYCCLRRLGKLSILTGLLIGAAVGAGFAAFESSGYAMQPIISYMQHIGYVSAYGQNVGDVYSQMIESINQTILIRGILAPGGHVAWAAISGAAFVIAAKINHSIQFSLIWNGKFLRLFIIPVVLHFLWDSPIAGWIGGFCVLFYAALVIFVWIVVFILINMGLEEINEVTKLSNNNCQ